MVQYFELISPVVFSLLSCRGAVCPGTSPRVSWHSSGNGQRLQQILCSADTRWQRWGCKNDYELYYCSQQLQLVTSFDCLNALNGLSTCGFKERHVSLVCRSQCFHWSWLRGPRGRFRFQRGFAGPFQVSGDRAAFVMENKMLSFRCTALTESCVLWFFLKTAEMHCLFL